MPSDPVSKTERHVREGEERVSLQIELIARLENAGRHEEARVARELLVTLTEALNAARHHLWQERRAKQ